MEIEPVEKNEICCICNKVFKNSVRCTFHNFDKISFIYMKEYESAHIECYIEKCLDELLKKKGVSIKSMGELRFEV